MKPTTTSPSHDFDLGDLGEFFKESVVDYLQFGAGAAAAIVGTDYLMVKVVDKAGKPVVPPSWAPVVNVVAGVVGGELVRQYTPWKDVGVGMIAGGVGIGIAGAVAMLMGKSLPASVKVAEATEAAGAGSQATSGFGFGRAFADGIGGLGGLQGLGAGAVERELLFGVGTPDLRAAGMFNGVSGATVQYEEGGGMAGATVQIEEPSLAGAIN